MDLDPAFVPAIGGALHDLDQEEVIRKIQRREAEHENWVLCASGIMARNELLGLGSAAEEACIPDTCTW